jgi:glutamine synthetase type III
MASGLLHQSSAIPSKALHETTETVEHQQHYVADEIAEIVLAWSVDAPLFRHFWKPLKLAESPSLT